MAVTPASIRNKNPGAMYPGPSSAKFGSTSFETLHSKDGEHKIARFTSDVNGAAAMFDLLAGKYTGMTVRDAITKWCGGYYVSTYLTVLADKAGVNADSILTAEHMRDPAIAVPLCRAMAWQEAGQDYPLDEAGWQAAHAMAFAPATALLAFSPDNAMPSPKEETRLAALKAFRDRMIKIWGTAIAGLAAAADSITGFFSNLMTSLKDWSPIQKAFVDAGANVRAIAIGVTCGAVVAALGKLMKGKTT